MGTRGPSIAGMTLRISTIMALVATSIRRAVQAPIGLALQGVGSSRLIGDVF